MKVKNLALKERPMKFSDVIGQNVVIKNLSAQSKGNKFFQSYLLYGHYGCGKTTTARILAAAINCRLRDQEGNPCGECDHCKAVKQGCADMVEIDGASNNGIDQIRQLKESVEYLPTVLDKKVYIIDEVHKLSDAAFNALLKVLEEPPAHVVFILATTDRDKIPATVLSRLAKYEFKRIPTDILTCHLKRVAERNGYMYTPEGLATIARNSDSSVRNAIKMLEIVAELPDGVTEENAGAMIGLLDPAKVYDLLDLLLGASSLKAFQLATLLMADGWDPRRLTAEMVHICSDAVLASERLDLVDGSDAYKGILKKICVTHSVARVIVVLDFLMGLTTALRESFGDRDVFRNGILLFEYNENNRICQLEEDVSLIRMKMERLESGIVLEESDDVSESSEYRATPDDFVPLAADDVPPWKEEEPSRREDPMQTELEKAGETEPETGAAEHDAGEEENVNDFDSSDIDIDPFAIFKGYSFTSQSSAESKTECDTDQKTEPDHMENEGEADKISMDDPDVVPVGVSGSAEDFLRRAENTEPVLDNLLTFGFTKLKEGETTVFETDEPAFYKMGKAFSGAMGGFPFGLRKAK